MLNVAWASDAAQSMSTAHSASSASLNVTPCTAAIIGWGMRAGALTALWKSSRCGRVKSARRPESVGCGSPCWSDTVVSSSLVWRGRKTKSAFGRKHTHNLHQSVFRIFHAGIVRSNLSPVQITPSSPNSLMGNLIEKEVRVRC
jgi:hypothetical protein